MMFLDLTESSIPYRGGERYIRRTKKWSVGCYLQRYLSTQYIMKN